MARLGHFLILSICCLSAVLSLSGAYADIEVEPGGNPGLPSAVVTGESQVSVDESGETVTVLQGGTQGMAFEYKWVPACLSNYPGVTEEQCANAYNCAEPRALQWTLWAHRVEDNQGQPTPDASWQPVLTECRLTTPPDIPTPRPQVTDALVLQEVRRLGLPRLSLRVQPADETLVNFETIFSAEPPPWAHTVQLLDYRVDVEAEPTTYVWQFGDGTSVSTQTPGAPYPAKDITHLYSDAGVSVAPRVDTSYAIRYRVDGGQWRSIRETVPAAGLPADLRIREATAVLVGD